MKKFILIIIVGANLWNAAVFCELQQPPTSPLLVRPLESGIVFPSLYSSIESSPTGLVDDKKSVVAVEWKKNLVSGATEMTEGFVGGGEHFGFGTMFGANVSGNTISFNRVSTALALGMQGSAIGFNAIYDLAGGTGVDCDLGVTVKNTSGFQLSLLATSIQSFRTIGAFNVGVGFTKPEKLQIEASWSYALFSVTQRHILTLNSVIYYGILGMGLNLAYTASTVSLSTLIAPALSLRIARVTTTLHVNCDTATGTQVVLAGMAAF